MIARIHSWRNRRIDHPSIRQLLAYRDGELRWIEKRRITAHVESCRQCLAANECLEKDGNDFLRWSAGEESVDLPDSPAGIARLQGMIRTWNAANLSEELLDYRRKITKQTPSQQVAIELEVFLGGDAARRLWELAGGDSPEKPQILARIHPVLAAFLGESNAAALGDRISQLLVFEQECNGRQEPSCP